MYISQLSFQGYKNTFNKCTVDFNEGLNVLLGENGCGKTAIINALRFVFKEQESFYAFSADDFFCSHDKIRMSNSVEIDVRLSKLDDEEQLTFLTWCDADFNGQLHLRITENALKPGQVKKDGGVVNLLRVFLKKILSIELNVYTSHLSVMLKLVLHPEGIQGSQCC